MAENHYDHHENHMSVTLLTVVVVVLLVLGVIFFLRGGFGVRESQSPTLEIPLPDINNNPTPAPGQQ